MSLIKRKVKTIGHRKMNKEEFERFWGGSNEVCQIDTGGGDYIIVDKVDFDVKTRKLKVFVGEKEIGILSLSEFVEKKKNNEKVE